MNSIQTVWCTHNHLASCQLAWSHFFPDKRRPFGVQMLGLYDLWKHKDEQVIPYQFGLRRWVGPSGKKQWGAIQVYEMAFWDDVLLSMPGDSVQIMEPNSFDRQVIQEGAIIKSYQDMENLKYALAYSFRFKWEGVNVIALNRGMCGAEALDGVFEEGVDDIKMLFCRRPDGQWKVSLRCPNDRVDVSEIADRHGGGGHTRAASFLCFNPAHHDLPFNRLPS